MRKVAPAAPVRGWQLEFVRRLLLAVAVIYAALAEFRDTSRNVMTRDEWLMMGHHMGGIDAMGGPVPGPPAGATTPAPLGKHGSPRERKRRGTLMRRYWSARAL